METNNTSFKLKRDNGMENAAVADIFSLFAEKWEDTSKKSAREVMSLILGKMKDTCLSTEEGDLEEHLKLLHANQYFAKIISHFQSNEPLLFAISGNTFEASMKNLSAIKRYAEKEEFSKDIIERINHFQTIIFDKTNKLRQKEASSNTKALIISFIIGAAGALFILNVGEEYFQSPFESLGDFGMYMLALLVLAGAAYGAIRGISNNKQ